MTKSIEEVELHCACCLTGLDWENVMTTNDGVDLCPGCYDKLIRACLKEVGGYKHAAKIYSPVEFLKDKNIINV